MQKRSNSNSLTSVCTDSTSSRTVDAASRSRAPFLAASSPAARANSSISPTSDSTRSSGKSRHNRKQRSRQRQLQNHSQSRKQNGAKPPPSSVLAKLSQLFASTDLRAAPNSLSSAAS